MTAAIMRRQGMYEIPVDPEVAAALCRRGRRRLRDIQAACGVPLQLDRSSRTLRFSTATPTDAALVRKHIAGLVGPRHLVPAAVWAELMRTRAIQDGEDATVVHLQEACGCRIHIERFRHEVRLFGEAEEIQAAIRLLAEFGAQVGEESVRVANAGSLCHATLNGIALEHGVTILPEASRVVILGLWARLEAAAEDVRKYIADPHAPRFAELKEKFELSQPPSDSPGMTGNEKEPTIEPHPSARRARGGAATRATAAPQQAAGCTTSGRPAAHAQLPPPVADVAAAAAGGAGCQAIPAACPTCGCGRFCSNCGVPVWQGNWIAVDFATYAAFCAQAQCTAMSGSPSGSATPDTPKTSDTLPPLDAGSPRSTPRATAFAEVQKQQGMQSASEGVTMVPMSAQMCLVPTSVQTCGGAGPMVPACMFPAGIVNGWMVDSSSFGSQVALVAVSSQAPSVDHLPWI